jgi:hypothetical protein
VLVSAKSNTAIVKCQQKVAFSDAWSGFWVFDMFSDVSCNIMRAGKHKSKLFKLATMRTRTKTQGAPAVSRIFPTAIYVRIAGFGFGWRFSQHSIQHNATLKIELISLTLFHP